MKMLRRKLNTVLVVILWMSAALTAGARQGVTTRYVYDANGRLRAVVLPSGETNVYDYDSAGNITSISHAAATGPVLLAFTPDDGTFGAVVSLYGARFIPNPSENHVRFNGTLAEVLSATQIEIVTRVPNGATTGPITITTAEGMATGGSLFTVIVAPPPTINGFTPEIGLEGTEVTITGSNFVTSSSGNKVTFNVTEVYGTTPDPGSLAVRVPDATASGKLTVRTASGVAVSAADFIIPPPNYSAASIASSVRMSIGESRLVTGGHVGQIGMVLFDSSPNGRISATVSTSETNGRADVSVLSPTGSRLKNVTRVGSTGCCDFVNGGFLDATDLSQGGTYTLLLASPSDLRLPGVTIALFNVPPDIAGELIVGGPTLAINAGAPGQNARLNFNGAAGQRIVLALSNITIEDGLASIYRPDGTLLVERVPFTTSGGAIDIQVLPTSGRYTIIVDPTGPLTGSMTLQADTEGGITIGGSSVTAVIPVAGQVARIAFEGISGQVVDLNLRDTTIPSSRVSILAPDGETLATTSGSAGIFNRTLPATGPYTIVVDPDGSSTGRITLRLSRTAVVD